MDLLQQFQEQWQKHFCRLTTTNCHLLVAVSGGVDSMVLVDLLKASGFAFTIAHCNFQLRGEESERDELFVREKAAKYQNEILVKRFETASFAQENKISIQEAARELRYGWFAEIIDGWQVAERSDQIAVSPHFLCKNHYLLTAHHADDNMETVLMNFFRGTGILGMTGIQPELPSRKLLRPLLGIRKEAILAYAAEKQLSFVEDSSNASDKYTRNFFRNSLLPQISEVFPQVEENLLQNIERMQEVYSIYRQSVEQQISKLLEKKGNEWAVPVLKWKKTTPLHTISWELIKPFGFNHTQTTEIIKLLDAANGSSQRSATHRMIRNRNWIIISPNESTVSEHILIDEPEQDISFSAGTLQLAVGQKPASIISTDPLQVMVDMKLLVFPLLLRKWKTGDYFYPLGMGKKKKISRFLIDLKLSKTEKEKCWVLESNKKIIWVLGHRIDDRFKITGQTEKVLNIAYRK